MQKQKNTRLLLALSAVLILISLLPYLDNKSEGLSIDKKQFTLNQQTVITDVLLASKTITNKLSYIRGKWVVNDKYELDPNMRDVFFSVLSQLEIRREVSESQNDSITNLIRSKGIEVSVVNNQELIKNYWIWGNKDSQTSFLMDDEQAYVVHIPGYKSYVAGIFEVPEEDWRTRRVFTALFTNLNTLKIEYPHDDIEFRYKDQFFEIINIRADSTQLISSLENLLFLQTDQYLQPSEYPTYIPDGIEIKTPFASISVSKLAGTKEKVKLYNTKNESNFYLGITPDSSYCLFNKARLNQIIVKKPDFQ